MRCVLLTLTLCLAAAGLPALAAQKHLKPFDNEAELVQTFKAWSDDLRRRQESRGKSLAQDSAGAVLPAPAPATAAKAEAGAAESVTNLQTAGVDEGGIVKLHGKHLVVLRRGRLFTIDVHDRRLEPVAAVPAFGGQVDVRGTWYDEMLIWGDTVAVIGYSYARGGTEIGLFDLSADGQIRHRATHHLRSNDYYSSRNYASRLIGSKLIFYTPLMLNPWASPLDQLPAQRRWHPDATPQDFKTIAPPSRIYRGLDPLEPDQGLALHSVTVCDLAREDMPCEGTAVMGPPGRVFYVSGESVYVWATTWRRRGSDASSRASLFRIPLDGSAPSAMKVAGAPIDQFSFLEGGDGFLNVLVRSDGRGDGMWAAEMSGGEMALLRVSLSGFGDADATAPAQAYRGLPKPAPGPLQNRFVGDFLLYGSGAGWYRPNAQAAGEQQQLHAVRFAANDGAYTVPLTHAVDRIEAIGVNAVAIGSDGADLGFTSLHLARYPVATDRYVRQGAAQGETRSHGFFYRPENGFDGLIGLPVIGGNEAAARQLRKPAAAMLYLHNRSLHLSELGALEASPGAGAAQDRCLASCVDWYGNARPLFVGTRVFALLGYEIVEGRLAGERIAEVRRISFVPPPQAPRP